MEADERRAKWQLQTDQIYASIGRFAVKFEHLCHAMQLNFMFLLHSHGLQSQPLANAVLAGQTADPLRRILLAMVAEVTRESASENDRLIVNNIFKRVQDLIEQRNDTIHRTWFVGWAAVEDEDFSTTSSWKFLNSRKGAELKPRDATAADFDKLASNAEELMNLVNRLGGCLTGARSIGNNFVWDEDKIVRLPPGTDPSHRVSNA